jgi:dihydroxyacetone kinase-like protein
MADAIGYDDLVRMVRAAAEAVRGSQALLSQLDSAGGDGDHGTTMARAMGLVDKAVAACKKKDLKSVLTDIGWGIMGVDGGATGPLFGTLFLGMADAVGDRASLDVSALADAFVAGLAALEQQTPARPGDKTMMDALVPAVTALRDAADAGQDVATALQAAAAAAARGAEATRQLQARFGRAKNLKEGSIGSQDPGATSVALLFRGFADAWA